MKRFNLYPRAKENRWIRLQRPFTFLHFLASQRVNQHRYHERIIKIFNIIDQLSRQSQSHLPPLPSWKVGCGNSDEDHTSSRVSNGKDDGSSCEVDSWSGPNNRVHLEEGRCLSIRHIRCFRFNRNFLTHSDFVSGVPMYVERIKVPKYERNFVSYSRNRV